MSFAAESWSRYLSCPRARWGVFLRPGSSAICRKKEGKFCIVSISDRRHPYVGSALALPGITNLVLPSDPTQME